MSKASVLKALGSAEELQITVKGRKTGKDRSAIVWFALDGDRLYLLPTIGSASNWYRNVLQNRMIEIKTAGARAALEAHPVEDKHRIDEIVAKFRSKYGKSEIVRYYTQFDAAIELQV